MQPSVRTLLVHDEERPMVQLKPFLERLGFQTARARSCAEAEAVLAYPERPVLIFTDTVLADGTWADVEALAERLLPPVPVIVVSRFVDLPFYLDVLESGVSDYVVPPFQEADVAYVVKGALLERSRNPFGGPGFSRTTTRTRSEVTQHAQNHTYPGVRAAHAQAGR